MAVWKPVRPDGKRECPECTNSFRADRTLEHATVAHFDRGVWPHRWCPGGRPPVNKHNRTAALPTGAKRPKRIAPATY